MEKILLFVSVIFILLLTFFLIQFINKKRYHAKLLRVRDRIENIYLVSCDPSTGLKPDVGAVAEYCEFVEPEKMETAIKEWENMLKESGNKSWDNEETRPTFRLKIIPYYFQDGEHVNEDFEEYGERLEWEIKADRSKRHGNLKRMNADWYKFAHHKQNTVTWSK